jgi:hypothetical protein
LEEAISFFEEKEGADAQTVSRPNLVVAMIDLDKQRMERRKRGRRWRRAAIS